MKTFYLLSILFITCLFASVAQAHGNHSAIPFYNVSQPSEIHPMQKQTLLMAMATAIIASVPQADLNGIALTAFGQAGKVMAQSFDGKKATVKQIENFNADVINIKMNGAEIQLAHDRLVAVEPADVELADKAIEEYSVELIVKANHEAEKIQLAEKEKEQKAAEALAANKGSKSSKTATEDDEQELEDQANATHQVQTKGGIERHFRSGKRFGKTPIGINKADFSDEGFSAIENDEHLKVTEV